LRKSVTLSLQENIDKMRYKKKFAISLSNPSFNPKELKKINIKDFNIQGNLSGHSKLISLAEQKLLKNWKINNKKNQTLITNGAKAGLYCIFKAIAGENKKNFAIINPNWPTYVDLIHLCNCKSLFFDTKLKDNYDINFQELNKFLSTNKIALLVLSSPNNPCGKVYDSQTIINLIKICNKNKCYLVIDESFSSHLFNKKLFNKKIQSNNDFLIIVNSFSKNFHLQGLRLGIIHASKKLIDLFTNIHIAVNGAPNTVSQYIVYSKKELLTAPDIKNKMLYVTNFLKSKNVDFYSPDGSFYLFPKIKNNKNFTKLANKNGLFFLGGKEFGTSYKGFYRFCFEKNEQELKKIIKIMDKYEIY